jgi:hypothetical protein
MEDLPLYFYTRRNQKNERFFFLYYICVCIIYLIFEILEEFLAVRYVFYYTSDQNKKVNKEPSQGCPAFIQLDIQSVAISLWASDSPIEPLHT